MKWVGSAKNNSGIALKEFPENVPPSLFFTQKLQKPRIFFNQTAGSNAANDPTDKV